MVNNICLTPTSPASYDPCQFATFSFQPRDTPGHEAQLSSTYTFVQPTYPQQAAPSVISSPRTPTGTTQLADASQNEIVISLVTDALILGGCTAAGALIGTLAGPGPGTATGASVGANVGLILVTSHHMAGCYTDDQHPQRDIPTVDARVEDIVDATILADRPTPSDTSQQEIPTITDVMDGGRDVVDATTIDHSDTGTDTPVIPLDTPNDRSITPDSPDILVRIAPPATYTSPVAGETLAPLYAYISYTPTLGSLSETVCYTQAGRASIASLEGTNSACPTGASSMAVTRPMHSVAFALRRSAELCWTTRSCEDSSASRCFEWGAIQCRNVDDSVIAHYTFDDGTANDSSGNGNHGIFRGTGPFTMSGAGIIGQAFQGDGRTRYLDLNSHLSNFIFSNTSGPRAFNMRFSVSRSTTEGVLLSLSNRRGAVPGFSVLIRNPTGTSPTLNAFLQDSSPRADGGADNLIDINSTPLSDGFHTMTVNYIPASAPLSNVTLELYLNGTLFMRNSALFNFSSSQFEAFSIGAANYGATGTPPVGAEGFFGARIDDTSIVSRPLRSNEAGMLHCATTQLANPSTEPAGCP